MSMTTEDKVYLFTLTQEEAFAAIDKWFGVMDPPPLSPLVNGHHDGRASFDIEITHRYGDTYEKSCYRTCLYVNCNHHMSDMLAHTVPRFIAQHSNIGVAHYTAYIDGDAAHYVLGCEACWNPNSNNNAVEWFSANCHKSVPVAKRAHEEAS
jgi:hypothetical protein